MTTIDEIRAAAVLDREGWDVEDVRTLLAEIDRLTARAPDAPHDREAVEEELRHGGPWLGEARNVLQRIVPQGDHLPWNSSEIVSVPFNRFEEVARAAAVAAVAQERRLRKREGDQFSKIIRLECELAGARESRQKVEGERDDAETALGKFFADLVARLGEDVDHNQGAILEALDRLTKERAEREAYLTRVAHAYTKRDVECIELAEQLAAGRAERDAERSARAEAAAALPFTKDELGDLGHAVACLREKNMPLTADRVDALWSRLSAMLKVGWGPVESMLRDVLDALGGRQLCIGRTKSRAEFWVSAAGCTGAEPFDFEAPDLFDALRATREHLVGARTGGDRG